MYRKPRFLELLQEIREEMSRECDYDMDLFAQSLGKSSSKRASISNAPGSQKAAVRHLPTKPKAKARRKS